MKKIFTLLSFLLSFAAFAAAEESPALDALLARIGGQGASGRIVFDVDPGLGAGGKEQFTLTSRDGKPCIVASSTLAGATGLGWYLNHVVHENLAWNRLTADLSSATFPLPEGEETHEASVDYRYYMNYCTFSYSCAFWTWERWEQEIDWMALHGINMPLQAVGVDVVWRRVMKELGYSDAQIGKHIAGPGFQAWWMMNNLEGWGGTNPEWWYARQEALAAKICARERELGMQPVLPGFSGQVPSSAIGSGSKLGALDAVDQGNWCAFKRPAFERPGTQFQTLAEIYYRHLHDVMGGPSDYYSMDLFHEGGYAPSGVSASAAYTAVYDAMNNYGGSTAKWVIQQWQWTSQQALSCTAVPRGRLIVLDLFSDGKGESGWNAFNNYSGQESVYCMLHNFGGRTGIHGRLASTIKNFYAFRRRHTGINGVGATPEGIETNPILYDALFELPWRSEPQADEWIKEYALARYGTQNATLEEAWALLMNSALNCNTSQQGTSEPIVCARPALSVSSVSSWSTAKIYYAPQDVIRAAALFVSQKGLVESENFNYDATDAVRQALTDYAQPLLAAIRSAYNEKNWALYDDLTARYLTLIRDLDHLLLTVPLNSLYRWTQSARAIADEAPAGYVPTDADRNWLEWNARKQVTTWGPEASCNNAGLRDYSNREWSGLLADYYAPRWERYFTALRNGTTTPTASQWYQWEDAFCNAFTTQYLPPTLPEKGDEVAAELFQKYFVAFTPNGATTPYYIYRSVNTALADLIDETYVSESYAPQFSLPEGVRVEYLALDRNADGLYAESERFAYDAATGFALPEGLQPTSYDAQVRLSDGTLFTFTLLVREKVEKRRSIKVWIPASTEGTLTLASANSGDYVAKTSSYQMVNTTADVTLTATPTGSYEFVGWRNEADGTMYSTRATLVYVAAAAIELRPIFSKNLWSNVEEDLSEHNVIVNYKQYVANFTATVNGQQNAIYTAASCPDGLYNVVPQAIRVARGGCVTIGWQSAGGLDYCRLSAYADLNADGDFTDAGELITTLGTKSARDQRVNAGSFTVVLPYDAPVGITHVRLRFDGAWQTALIDAATDAVPADAKTMRMVYDIKLQVLDYPDTETTTTVRSANPSQGTILSVYGGEFDNQNPATVLPGKQLTVEAAANVGYSFSHWTDEHDRTVSHANPYTFRPAESGTLTAHFTLYNALLPPVAAPTPTSSPLYDLAGRRLAHPTKAVGVYIDGKSKAKKVSSGKRR